MAVVSLPHVDFVRERLTETLASMKEVTGFTQFDDLVSSIKTQSKFQRYPTAINIASAIVAVIDVMLLDGKTKMYGTADQNGQYINIVGVYPKSNVDILPFNMLINSFDLNFDTISEEKGDDGVPISGGAVNNELVKLIGARIVEIRDFMNNDDSDPIDVIRFVLVKVSC
jgi:hypothetical protein